MDDVFYCEGKSSACKESNGGCSNLCIPLSFGFTCACPDFSRLAGDNATCIAGKFLTACLTIDAYGKLGTKCTVNFSRSLNLYTLL